MAEHVTVLLVAAGARGDGLALDEEHRAIRGGLTASRYGNVIRTEVMSAARPGDLPDALMRHLPTVLHLSGRGTPEDGLLFRTNDGGEAPIVTAGLANLLAAAAPQLRLVVVTACWTEDLAHELAKVAGCVLGIRRTITDSAAAGFSRVLYNAVGHGYPVGQAVAIATAALQMHGVHEHDAVMLAHAAHIEPAHLFIIPSRLMPPGPRDAAKPRVDTTLPLLTKTVVAVITTTQPEDDVTEAAIRTSLDGIGQVRRITIRGD